MLLGQKEFWLVTLVVNGCEHCAIVLLVVDLVLVLMVMGRFEVVVLLIHELVLVVDGHFDVRSSIKAVCLARNEQWANSREAGVLAWRWKPLTKKGSG